MSVVVPELQAHLPDRSSVTPLCCRYLYRAYPSWTLSLAVEEGAIIRRGKSDLWIRKERLSIGKARPGTWQERLIDIASGRNGQPTRKEHFTDMDMEGTTICSGWHDRPNKEGASWRNIRPCLVIVLSPSLVICRGLEQLIQPGLYITWPLLRAGGFRMTT